MTQQERYNQVLLERHNRSMNRKMDDFSATGEGVQDFSGPVEAGVGREAIDAKVREGSVDRQGYEVQAAPQAGNTQAAAGAIGAGSEMAKGIQGGANPYSTLGNAGMASGNPYLMAAGLGLQVYGQGEENKRKEKEAQRVAYNERIKERQAMMGQIAQMGIA